ncbi:MAG TPA: hypothetical protein VK923_05145 [Euzebyales bacterium]|nr:hypothetical protein [Euzebyales bacterium]
MAGTPPGPTPVVVELPPLPYLMVDGQGDPNTATAYLEAVAALYPICCAVRKAVVTGPGSGTR